MAAALDMASILYVNFSLTVPLSIPLQFVGGRNYILNSIGFMSVIANASVTAVATVATVATACTDVIGLGVGIGVMAVLTVTVTVASYLYRRTPTCPYCSALVAQPLLQEHLLTCPKHLEFWSRKGSQREIVYVRSGTVKNIIKPPPEEGV